MFVILIFILIICPNIQIIYSSGLPSPELHIKYGGHALSALQRLLNFFESDANNVNLDGLYGLRIAQGQLNALHESLTNKQSHLTDNNNIIQSLSAQIERIANVSLNEIAHEASSYLQRFSLIASRPFVIEYEPRKTHKDLIEYGLRKSDFDEERSDICFAELLGKSKKKQQRFYFIEIFIFNFRFK